jgi:hypothetical protein
MTRVSASMKDNAPERLTYVVVEGLTVTVFVGP